MKEIANFFWHGDLTLYEYKCIESFVKHNFIVNVWSYSDLELPAGANLCNAEEILPKDHLTKYKQKHFLDVNTPDGVEYTSLAAFSDAFRFTLLNIQPGWWFDCDVFCLKDQNNFSELKTNKNIVAGLMYNSKDNVFDCGCGVIYFKDQTVSQLFYDELQARCIQNNYIFSGWAHIGPHLIHTVIKENNFVKELFPEEYFYAITWTDLDLIINPARILEAKEQIKNAYCLHLWNSQLSQVYNIKHSRPEDNLLAELFFKN